MAIQDVKTIPTLSSMDGTEDVYVKHGNEFLRVPLSVFLTQCVSTRRKINGHQLTEDISLSPSDIETQLNIGPTPAENLDVALYALNTYKQNKAIAAMVTLSVDDWDDSFGSAICTKAVAGVTKDSIVLCDSPDAAVSCTAQGTGTLTFSAAETPTEAVTVKVVVL